MTSRREIIKALSKPVGIAADSGNRATYLVLCENGAVYTTNNGGQRWLEVTPIPSSLRESALRESEGSSPEP